MKLNLGCGSRKIHGFVNVDAREDCNPDVVYSIENISSLYQNKATLIYACHVLEHFSRTEVSKALLDWHKCLVPGGKIRLSVPSIDTVIKAYGIYEDLNIVHGYLYGGQKNPFDYHKTIFNFDVLQKYLISAGFTDIHKYDWRTTEHAYVDDYSQAYLPHMDKLNGLQMSLNVEAIKPEFYPG